MRNKKCARSKKVCTPFTLKPLIINGVHKVHSVHTLFFNVPGTKNNFKSVHSVNVHTKIGVKPLNNNNLSKKSCTLFVHTRAHLLYTHKPTT